MTRGDRCSVPRPKLFACSDGGAEGWAVIASLIEACKLDGVDPYAFLADMRTRIVDGHLASELTSFCPAPTTKPRRSKTRPENDAYHGQYPCGSSIA
jgi:IS66 C-terminal element